MLFFHAFDKIHNPDRKHPLFLPPHVAKVYLEDPDASPIAICNKCGYQYSGPHFKGCPYCKSCLWSKKFSSAPASNGIGYIFTRYWFRKSEDFLTICKTSVNNDDCIQLKCIPSIYHDRSALKSWRVNTSVDSSFFGVWYHNPLSRP